MTVRTIANTDRARTGIDYFHYAVIEKDERDELVYKDIVDLPNTISVNVTVNNLEGTLYADNKPVITYQSVGTADVAIERTTVPEAVLAELLGSPREGAVRHVTPGTPGPYVGIAWRILYSDSFYQYVKLYKGRFQEPELNAATSTDSVEFQTATINATFIPTTYQKEFDVPNPSGTGTIKRNLSMFLSTVDETDPLYDDEGATWFDAIYETPETPNP